MLETLVLLGFLAFIVSTLWWPPPMVRVLGGLFLGTLVFATLHQALGTAAAGASGALVAVLAVWGLPPRVLKRICFTVPSLVLLVYVTTWLMYTAPGNPFRAEKEAN